ncbi:MAG: hypothetical protein HY868_12860 [Chloroflexi bacterium]|nr:hypothetical protein [Chloroflexota bacterium]
MTKDVMLSPIRIEKKLRNDSAKVAKRKGWTISFVVRSVLQALARGDERVIRIVEEELNKK